MPGFEEVAELARTAAARARLISGAGLPLGELSRVLAGAYGDRPAIAVEASTPGLPQRLRTYAALDEDVSRLAAAYAAASLGAGHTVAILCANRIDVLLHALALEPQLGDLPQLVVGQRLHQPPVFVGGDGREGGVRLAADDLLQQAGLLASDSGLLPGPALLGHLVAAEVPRKEYAYDVRMEPTFDSRWLPTQPPVSQLFADGNWRYDDTTMDIEPMLSVQAAAEATETDEQVTDEHVDTNSVDTD